MGIMSTLKKACHYVAGVAKNKTMLMIGALIAGASAFAEGGADYAIVAKDQSGAITFAPEKLVNPVVDGMIAGYQAWAVVVVIIVVVGLLVWIVKKK